MKKKRKLRPNLLSRGGVVKSSDALPEGWVKLNPVPGLSQQFLNSIRRGQSTLEPCDLSIVSVGENVVTVRTTGDIIPPMVDKPVSISIANIDNGAVVDLKAVTNATGGYRVEAAVEGCAGHTLIVTTTADDDHFLVCPVMTVQVPEIEEIAPVEVADSIDA